MVVDDKTECGEEIAVVARDEATLWELGGDGIGEIGGDTTEEIIGEETT